MQYFLFLRSIGIKKAIILGARTGTYMFYVKININRHNHRDPYAVLRHQ